MTGRLPRWVVFNSLSLATFTAFLIFLVLQAIFGWHAYNDDLADFAQAPVTFWHYLGTGHFIEATFENWESEFLQMGSYVLLTAFLVQRGSPESKPIPDEHGDQSEPEVGPDSPGPVRRGGLPARLYQYSLTIALLGMFAVSFLLHLLGGSAEYNHEQSLLGQPPISVGQFFTTSEFWFQSMQNWQSEFLAVASLVVLSIFLRQKGSPESKPVAAPHHQTGS
jgi:hypothetical protein